MRYIHTLIHKAHNPDLGVLLVRLALGLVFIHAGWFKLTNMDLVINAFAGVGIPAFLAYTVAYFELLSGLLMAVGIFVRYAGVIIIIIMSVAIWKAHWIHGYGLQNGGYEYALTLLILAISMITTGAGKYALKTWVNDYFQVKNN